MSTSELHSRLEHLVSYSSQLIFVSNDKSSQQSKVVDAFLGHQAENTEVAIIDAKQTTFLQDYRKQLFTQLIGISTTTDFERPLNQLLSALNEYEGPILIIVSHAENLPQKFLQELWELILQSRFAANKHHLNVLLFSQPEWAEQAKSWLPTNTGNKPILLNSGSILSATASGGDQFEETDLEELISSKREQFAKRIRGRETRYESIQPVLYKPWLGGSIIVLFLSVFGGMLYWQYPEVANTWWNDLVAKTDTPIDDSLSQTVEISPALAVEPAQAADVVINQQVQAKPSLIEPDIKKGPTERIAALTSEPLVTDWKNVLKQLDSASTSQFNPSGLDKLNQATEFEEASLTATSGINETPQAVTHEFKAKNDEILKSRETELPDDYEVKNITSIEELETNSNLFAPSSSIDVIVEEKPLVNSSEKENSPSFTYDEMALLKLPTSSYLLQIAAMGDRVTMQTYIRQNQLRNQLWVYKTQRFGGEWFVLLHNQSYSNLDLARNAINTLSLSPQQSPPFVKTAKQVLQEINR